MTQELRLNDEKDDKLKMNFFRTKDRINWSVFYGLLFLHLGAIPAFFCFSWKNLFIMLFLYWMTNGLGICLGYHRYFTHRGFTLPKWLEYFVAICGTLTSQGGPITWVASHRYHHAFSDEEIDLHSPRHGFWWAHMLWFVYRNPLFETPEFYKKYAPDLYGNRFYQWLEKNGWIFQAVLGVALFFIGGLPAVFWGIFLRTVLALHGTWLVNSATHLWGYTNFDSKDDSKNLWWVAIVSLGEGWHNNHHANQRSARHGLMWWEIDATYLAVKALQFFGLAGSVVTNDNLKKQVRLQKSA